ncbi:MAG: T9SS type A sorting domain-containing protein [Saprospirales bacterium]|nr:T9SS type A sorting domain-containing protein [Saprospirales bacterium]
MQTIEVVDDQLPVVLCPTDTAVQVPALNCRAVVNLPDLRVVDGCSSVTGVTAYWTIDGAADTLSATLSDFSGNDPAASDTLAVFGEIHDFPVGATVIRLVATDACGNTASYEMALTVWDSLPPVAICDTSLTVFLDDLGYASLPAGLPDNGSADSCGSVYFKVRRAFPGSCDPPGLVLDDYVSFCCADFGDTIPVVLRVYDVPLPNGPVADTLAAGQYSECTTPVRVIDTNPPKCKAPDHVTVSCDLFDPSLATYGDIEVSCRVDSSLVAVDYQLFDTACSQGTISRVFQVFDGAGDSGQCTQNILVDNEQHYFVRFPDDLILTMCDTTGNYGVPEFFGVQCEDMVVQFAENIVFGVPDACFKIERTWKVFNLCRYDPGMPLVTIPNPEPHAIPVHPDNLPGPVVSEAGVTGVWAPSLVKVNAVDPAATNFSTYWTANANGFQYKQVIKVIDIEQPYFVDCPAAGPTVSDTSENNYFLWNGNYSTSPDNPEQDLCEGAAEVSVTISDACFGPDLGVDYLLFLDLDDDGAVETVVNSTDLPAAGTIPYNNINTPNFAGGEIKQFDLRLVASNEKYQFAVETTISGRNRTVRLAWNHPSAPGNFSPLQLPLGNHRIRWTIYDGCGNENTCEYTFRVEDPDGTCAPTVLAVGGTVRTEASTGVNNVAIQIDGTHPNLPAFNLFALTNDQGFFAFEAPTGSSYTVTPFRNDDHLNGVSTFDLLLINKHVLGLTPLNSPYKFIAADANGSKTVTTFDIVELRKLILGLYQQLPSSTSWVFVPADHVFTDPTNPFLNGLPETHTATNVQPGNLSVHDFIGIKVGDINGNANPGLVALISDDRSAPTLFIDLPDLHVEAGDEFTVPVRAAGPVAGFQLTLDFPGLEVLDLTPGPNMSAEHFAVFNDMQALGISWETGGQANFTLRLRARETGRLRELLRLSNRVARPEAYSADLEVLPIALRFGGETAAAGRFELYQNQPNPFTGDTEIRFYLPEAETATLRIWDTTGRLLAAQTQVYPAGLQSVMLDEEALGNATGVLYYQLETPAGNAVRKMLRQ